MKMKRVGLIEMASVEQLLSEYTTVANDVELNLKDMLNTVAGGRVPTYEHVDELNKTIEDLQGKYSTIRDMAEVISPMEDKEAIGKSVQDYMSIIEKSRIKEIVKQINKIELQLKRFISVKSLVAAYSDALQPFQSEASKMLSQLEGITSDVIPESIISVSETHELFLSGLEEEDFDSAEGEKLLERLSSAYPYKVQHGLILKKYYIAHKNENEASLKTHELVLDTDNSSDEVFLLPSTNDEKSGEMNTDKSIQAIPEPIDEISSNENPPSDIHIEYEVSEYITAINRIKDSSPSATAFKSDLTKMPKEAHAILPIFTNLGALLESQLFAFGVYLDCFPSTYSTRKVVHDTLNQLMSKNVLAAYKIKSNEDMAYCLTAYGYYSMFKSSIASNRALWTVSYGQFKLCGKQRMESNPLIEAISCNADLLLYMSWAKKTISDDAYKSLIANIKWQGGFYSVPVIWQEDTYNCMIEDPSNHCTPGENRLIIFKQDEELSAPSVTSEGIGTFGIHDEKLYKWLGHWIEEGESDIVVIPTTEISTNAEMHESVPESEEIEQTEDAEEAEEIEVAKVSVQEENNSSFDNPVVDPTVKPSHINESCTTGTSIIMKPEVLSKFGIIDKMNSKERAQKLLDYDISPDHYGAYIDLLVNLIEEDVVIENDDIVENRISQAVVLAKALTFHNPIYQNTYESLIMAFDSPIQEHHYSGDRISSLFESEGFDTRKLPAVKLIALLRALFAPDTAYDYSLYSYARSIFDDYEATFNSLVALKPLYNLFLKIGDLSSSGFSKQLLRTFSDNKADQDLLRQIKNNAQQMIPEPKVKCGLKAMVPMLSNCFGNNSDLRECMIIIAEDKRDSRDFVEIIIKEFCDDIGGEADLSQEKIEYFFEENWKKAISDIRGPREVLIMPREKVIDNVRARLLLMGQWLQITEDGSKHKKISPQLLSLRNEILTEIDCVMPIIKSSCVPFDCAVVNRGLELVRERLNGRLSDNLSTFSDFLRTGIFCIDENKVPFIDSIFTSYQHYEPWRNALRHIAAPVLGLRETLEEISNPDNQILYDNIGQAIYICEYLNKNCGDHYSLEQYKTDIDATNKAANEAIAKFKGELELAFAYGRISESFKEDILEGVELVNEKFEEYHYYGCLRAFLDALRNEINNAALTRMEELRQDVEERIRTNTSEKLAAVLEVARLKLNGPERNFVVAEEYINRYDAGIYDKNEIPVSPEGNVFLDFINTAFNTLYGICHKNESSSLRGFGPDYVERELKKKKVSAQYQDSSRMLLKNMPNRPEEVTPAFILTMLKEVGFDARNAKIMPSSAARSSMVHLSVDVNPDAKDKAEYSHPVDIMGTKLKSPVDVICLFGRMQPNDIVDKVCKLELSRTAIVFLNGTLDLPGRRQITERFHREKSGQNPFLLIDWVLLLYLALHQKTERLPILLSCSLPYTSSFQPFVIKGSVPDEMFIGRKKELNQILDPNGPVIVYGGRQLGKTALLERAQSLSNHPQKKEYTVLIRAAEYSIEEMLVSAVVQELDIAGIHVSKSTTMRALCEELRAGYFSKKWLKLLVLIDEADTILDNFRTMEPAYKPIIPLSDLSRDTGNDFKFVFAGLHNVCRAANDPNTVFGQLGGALCIKPLSAADALALLSRPLRYMGFNIDAAHLEHILVNTSFYPGIVHYVGYSLIENLSTRYADYYQASRGNPPYDLTDKQLGEIMSDNALNEKINERIRWTLQVDLRYFMLARCIAYLYYDNPENNKTGHNLESIIEYASLLEISHLEHMNHQEYMALLKEMEEMGILVHPSEGTFRLRQRRFLDAIGSSREKIESDIRMAEGGINA